MSYFNSPTYGKIQFNRLIKEIVSYVEEDPRRNYKIIIGSDSQEKSQVEFITAIVIHRIGKGGRYFWRRTTISNINSLRHKIYQEVNLSLVTAQELIEKLRDWFQIDKLLSENLEIHVDIGENGPTKELIREITGLVRSNGFKVKTKPESYAASHVADKHT